MRVWLVMLLLGVSSVGFAADEGHVSRITHEVSNEIYSPFCPGKTLAMCPSPNAAEVRMQIQNMATEGMEPDQIKEKIVAQYGEEFRLVDPPLVDNVGLLGILLVGAILAGLLVRSWSTRRSDEAASEVGTAREESKPDDGYVSELRDIYKS